MTQYARGRRKEWDVVKRLRADGWAAQRSAGSHGLWDVCAKKRGRCARFVQVKYTADGRWEDKNTDALLALAADDDPDDLEVWVYRKGIKDPVVYAAVHDYLHGWGWEWMPHLKLKP